MKKGRANKSETLVDPRRFDVAMLRDIAGDKVFLRGVDYYNDNHVEIVSIDGERVLAKVIGSELYCSQMKGAGKKFGGACSCPAFLDWGFCKHLVATALAMNGLSPEEFEQVAGRLTKIRNGLRNSGVDQLVEMIICIVEHKPWLLQALELAVAARADKRLQVLREHLSEAEASSVIGSDLE
jgi:uncharacterized Zn finger protein